jgi:hypothetical protein
LATRNDQVNDFLTTLLRIAMSFGLLVIFIVGEWFLHLLVGVTILEGTDPQGLGGKALGWVEQFSVLAVALMWAIHILAEVALFALRQLSKR